MPALSESESEFLEGGVEEPSPVTNIPDILAVVDGLEMDHFDKIGTAPVESAEVALGSALTREGVVVHRE